MGPGEKSDGRVNNGFDPRLFAKQLCAAAKAPIFCGSTGQHIFQVVTN